MEMACRSRVWSLWGAVGRFWAQEERDLSVLYKLFGTRVEADQLEATAVNPGSMEARARGVAVEVGGSD